MTPPDLQSFATICDRLDSLWPFAIVFDGLHPFAIVCDRLCSFATICDGFKCLQPFAIVCDRLRRFATICNRLRPFAIVCDRLRLFATQCWYNAGPLIGTWPVIQTLLSTLSLILSVSHPSKHKTFE